MSKKNIFFVFLLASYLKADQKSDWLKERQAWIEQAEITKSIDDRIRLERIVTGIGRNLDSASPEAKILYYRAQTVFISIPEHAKYYVDQVAAARRKSKDFITDLNYHKKCETLLKTLPHLPSPETVLVLGEMLESDADLLTLEQRIEVLRKSENGGNHVWYYPAGVATLAFQDLGIRQLPPGSGLNGTYTTEVDLMRLRSWWEEVKSGKRTFSFKGQSVEYRFNPDGTWETIPIANPPDDGPQATQKTTAARPVKRPVADRVDTPDTPAGHAWWWYGIGGAALLAAGAWFMRKKIVG